MLDRRGAVALISGANRGIGRAIAEGLAGAGWHLSLGGRQPEALPTCGEDTLLEHYDAADPDAAERWVKATLDRFGRIDAVIANAGIWKSTTIPEADPAVVEAMWRVNSLAPLLLVKAAWEPLRASGSGRFLAVASLAGKRAYGANVGYSMSKFAVVALTQQVRSVGWGHGIRATALCPSWVNTDMASIADVGPEQMSQPEDLAALVVTHLALPNNASVGEIMVNCRFEPGF